MACYMFLTLSLGTAQEEQKIQAKMHRAVRFSINSADQTSSSIAAVAVVPVQATLYGAM